MDSDIILLKPLNETFNNVVIAEETDIVRGSILAFEKLNKYIGSWLEAFLSENMSQVLEEDDVSIHSTSSFFPVSSASEAEKVFFQEDFTDKNTKAFQVNQAIKSQSYTGVKLFDSYNQRHISNNQDFGKAKTIAKLLLRKYCILCSQVL